MGSVTAAPRSSPDSGAEEVDPSDYTFRTWTQMETVAPAFALMNKGVFIGVAGRQPAGVIYETYLVE